MFAWMFMGTHIPQCVGGAGGGVKGQSAEIGSLLKP